MILTATAFAQQPAAPSAAAPERHIVCEHAAPPPGSHWVCDKPDQPCQCHLESNVPGRPIFGEGADQPWPPLSERQKAAGEAGCKKVSVKHFVAPFYPQTARLAQVSGAVTVLARLSSEGRVISAIPEGPSALYASALGAVRQWTFHNPDKVRSVTVVINYVLRQESLTTNTPATDVSGDLPCRVEISAVPNLPPDAQPN